MMLGSHAGNLRKYSAVYAVIALVLCLSACTIQLISTYDEQTDKSVTALQRKMETFFVKLESLERSPDCVYEKQKSFYEDAKVDLSAIKLRVDALPMNNITQQQMELLRDSLQSLEELHQKKSAKPAGSNCMSKDEIQVLHDNFNTSFTAILKLELAKKRGDKK